MAACCTPTRTPRSPTERRLLFLGAWILGAALAHAAIPAGPHATHWLHLAAQKAHYVPILLGVAWFGAAGALGSAAAVSVLFAWHIALAWAGDAMAQADQIAEIGNLWLVAVLSAVLVGRLRAALVGVRHAHAETLDALALSLELREQATAGHSRRVREYSLVLADALGLPPPERETLALGAFLHDIGKLGTPDAILLKEGAPTPAEWEVLRRHPDAGAALLGALRSLRGAAELVRAHHERWDGTGYPRGLRGAAIPVGARVFAVADVLDALTTARPYHDPLPLAEAAARIVEGRGTHFDPAVVDAFRALPLGTWAAIAAGDGIPASSAPVRAPKAA